MAKKSVKEPSFPPLAAATSPVLLAAEQVTERAATIPGYRLTPSDFEALQIANYDRRTVAREIGRMKLVRENQMKAGTAEERAAAEERLKEARANLDQFQPEIEEFIAKKRAELQDLQNAVREAEAVYQAMAAAVDFLQSERALPRYVRAAHAAGFSSDVHVEFDARISPLRDRANHLTTLIALPYDGGAVRTDDRVVRSHLAAELEKRGRPHNSDAVQELNGERRVAGIRVVDWPAIAAKLQEELDGINTELEALTSGRDAAAAEVDRVKELFVPV